MHILLADDHHERDGPTFPWPTFQHYKQPLNSAVVFDCNVMDDVVALAMEALHADPVAHMVDTSLDRDAVRADLAVDAFPVHTKWNILRH